MLKIAGMTGMIVLLAAPALAHHSFAMFDSEKEVVLEGTVKEFQWTNPHSWLQVSVPDKDGKVTEWSLELGSPAQNATRGIRYKTFNPGDKLTVTIHPLRNGDPGGSFMYAVMADGRTVGRGNAPAAPAPGGQ